LCDLKHISYPQAVENPEPKIAEFLFLQSFLFMLRYETKLPEQCKS